MFSTGVLNLFANVRKTLTGISAVTSFGGIVIGAIGVVMMVVGGRAILAGTMTLGDFIIHLLRRHAGGAAHPDVVDRHAAVRSACRPRSDPGDQGDGDRGRRGCLAPAEALKGEVVFDDVSFEYAPACRC